MRNVAVIIRSTWSDPALIDSDTSTGIDAIRETGEWEKRCEITHEVSSAKILYVRIPRNRTLERLRSATDVITRRFITPRSPLSFFFFFLSESREASRRTSRRPRDRVTFASAIIVPGELHFRGGGRCRPPRRGRVLHLCTPVSCGRASRGEARIRAADGRTSADKATR